VIAVGVGPTVEGSEVAADTVVASIALDVLTQQGVQRVDVFRIDKGIAVVIIVASVRLPVAIEVDAGVRTAREIQPECTGTNVRVDVGDD
jgi:hypothetical protein